MTLEERGSPAVKSGTTLAEDMYWEWSDKPVKLGDLSNIQLNIIKRAVNKSVKERWFNNTKAEILNAIQTIIDNRKKDPMYDIYNKASERFTKKAHRKAEILFNVLNKKIGGRGWLSNS